MSTYLDASFAVSLYSPDKNSVLASSQTQTAVRPLIVSSLCEIETANAFRLAVFRKNAIPEEGRRSLLKFALHLDAGILLRIALPKSTFLRAEQLSEQYTAQLGTRGADLLHIAAALELGADQFFSFDLQQRKLASAVGLTLNPI